MPMDYLRSATLAGGNTTRLLAATIHGAARRSDADGGSSVPYFSGLSGKSLTITTDRVPAGVTVNFISDSFSTAIATINTALATASTTPVAGAIAGVAFDTDGSLSIQTVTNGGKGWVEVTGGTSLTLLGFNINTGRRLLSVGGDIPSAPEGRLGNNIWTMFPGKGDDFKMAVFQRPLAALAQNMDVVYSETAKQDAVLQRLGLVTASTGITDASTHLFLGSSVKIFNGFDFDGNKLSKSGTTLTQDLSAYFVLVDPTTRKRLPNYATTLVVGNVGSVTAPASIGDAATLSAGDNGNNVLGLNIKKAGPIGAVTISDGHLIYYPGLGSSALVGDIIEITGAANTTPWDNNGMRWVVRQIIGTDYISVRPASKAELESLLGATAANALNQGQTVTALNSTASGTFGSVNIWSGSFPNNVSLVVSPSIANATSVEVWATMPLSHRDTKQTPMVVPGLAVPRAFMNPVVNSTPHLAARRLTSGDTADLLSLEDQTGSYLLRVTAAGNIVGSSSPFSVQGGGFTLTGTSGAASLAAGTSLGLSAGAGSASLTSTSVTSLFSPTGTVAVDTQIKLTTNSSLTTGWKIDASGNFVTLGIGGAITMAGALSGVTSLGMAGTLTGVTSLSMGGALSGVTTLGMAGALSGVTSLGMSGPISGVTSLGMNSSISGATAIVGNTGFTITSTTSGALDVLSTTASNLTLGGVNTQNSTLTSGYTTTIHANYGAVALEATGAGSVGQVTFKTGVTPSLRWTIDSTGTLIAASPVKITGVTGGTATNEVATFDTVNTAVKGQFTLNFGSDFGVLVASDKYVPVGCLASGGTPVWNTNIVGATVPRACFLKSMVLSATVYPTGGTESYTVYQISGGTVTSTGLTVTATAGTAGAVLLTATGSVSAAAGDMFAILRHVVSGTVTVAMSQLGIALVFANS